MKWRKVRDRTMWRTGPPEGDHFYRAKKSGVTYTVQAAWSDPWRRTGNPVWWMGDSNGNNLRFPTMEAAQAEAERRAGIVP